MPKKILVVEDERPIANALSLKFNHSGFQSKTAYNGKEALEILEKETFDLMLLDLMMPKMDGFGVLEALQKKEKKPLIVVTTNLSQQEDMKRAKTLGATGYLVKSDTPLSKIIEYVNQVLSS